MAYSNDENLNLMYGSVYLILSALKRRAYSCDELKFPVGTHEKFVSMENITPSFLNAL